MKTIIYDRSSPLEPEVREVEKLGMANGEVLARMRAARI